MQDDVRHAGLVIVFAVALFGVGPAGAALTVTTDAAYPGQVVVVDDVTGYYWYWGLEDLVGRTYAQQETAIADLNANGGYFGRSNWHMASAEEMSTLWMYPAADMAAAFEPTIVEGPLRYWEGRYDEPASAFGGSHYGAYIEEWGGGGPDGRISKGVREYSDTDNVCGQLSAWVVSTSPPPPVIPAPGAVALAMSGLCLLAGLYRQRTY
jgi:hypothetical protein